jgi:hypothetical protein
VREHILQPCALLSDNTGFMAYQALPEKLDSRSSTEDTNDTFQPSWVHNREARRQNSIWRLSIANLVLLVVQFSVFFAYNLWHWMPVGESKFQATYGFDTKYMTLSHDYDWLWEDRAIQRAGAIALRKGDGEEVLEYGIISMCVIQDGCSVGYVIWKIVDLAFRFHQLHCVASLRSALQTAYEGGHVAFDENEDPHWPHCLHYLHQVSLHTLNGNEH